MFIRSLVVAVVTAILVLATPRAVFSQGGVARRPLTRSDDVARAASAGALRADPVSDTAEPASIRSRTAAELVESDLTNVVVRAASQLRFCYQEFGLKLNPDLAGDLALVVSVNSRGIVYDVRVAGRSWRGPGAAETERCVRSRILAWRLPPNGAPGEYPLKVGFTSG